MAYCEKCGADMGQKKTCPSCGATVAAAHKQGKDVKKVEEISQNEKPPESGIAIASLVIGIVSILGLAGGGVMILPAIVGLILGITARKDAPQSSFATAGFVLNLVAVGCASAILLTASACMGCWACTPFCVFPFGMLQDVSWQAVALM